MTTTLRMIRNWYEFALQQMAAESYLDQHTEDGRSLSLVLQEDNNDIRSPGIFELQNDFYPGRTRMTSLQATEFAERYRVVNHQPNTASGFSATLLFDTETQQYTLSFRSTEYMNPIKGGDFGRDAQGADMDISQYGFAFAQIADMEKYYQTLNALLY